MPHIVVNIWPGRTDETKAELANRLALETAEVLKMDAEYVSVGFHEVPEADWDAFCEREIEEKPEEIFKRPGEPARPR